MFYSPLADIAQPSTASSNVFNDFEKSPSEDSNYSPMAYHQHSESNFHKLPNFLEDSEIEKSLAQNKITSSLRAKEQPQINLLLLISVLYITVPGEILYVMGPVREEEKL